MAVLYFVGAGLYVVLLGLVIAGQGTLRSLLTALSPQGAGPVMLLNLGPMLAIYFTIMIAVAGLLGYGMWTLRNWARIVTAIITAVSLIVGVVFLVRIGGQLNISPLLLDFVRIGLCLLVLWYLWRPNVRAAFLGSQHQRNELSTS
jgi:hypothetical protein